MKECLESLISASLLGQAVARLVADGGSIHWVLLAVVDHLPVGVNERRMDLQALQLIRRLGTATMRRRILRGGLLSESAGSCPLGKLLQVCGGSLAQARPTRLFVVFGAMFVTFASHLLSRKNETRVRKMIGMLESRW
jgi:hypothetical protein